MIKAQILPALLVNLLFCLLCGVAFPLLVWGFAQIFMNYQANGSLHELNGKVIASDLIGQAFSSPKYFHPRPSAAGAGYDPLSSGGTNLGPTSKKLYEGIQDDPSTKDVDESFQGVATLAKLYRDENRLNPAALIPADAVTRSGSGLDPDISPQNAHLQARRIAQERSLRVEQVLALIDKSTKPRFLGIFGEPRVSTVELNLTLDALKSK